MLFLKIIRMERNEISTIVKEVIAQNSRHSVSEVTFSSPLDKYISSFMKDRLASKLKNRFTKVQLTDLKNQLYDSIKKVSRLIDYIEKVYK